MKTYEKPVITVDAGLAEGIYAASGAGNSVSASDLSVVGNWGSSGQAKFTLDLTNVNPSQLTVTVTFNKDLASGWGGNASVTVSGNKLTLTWYSSPDSADITVQANDIKQLRITGYSASNA